MSATMTKKKEEFKRGRPPLGKEKSSTDTSPSVGKHVSPRLAFHLEPELLAAFKEYVSSLKHKPTESQSLRDILKDYLKTVGFWPPKDK